MMLGFYLGLTLFLLAFVGFLFWASRDRPLTASDVDELRKDAEAYARTEEFARFYRDIKALAEKPSEASM